MSSLKERAETQAAIAPLTRNEIHRIFYGLMLGGFLSAVNQTIVASALPTIGRDLGDLHNLSWVIIAYLLSSTVVAPLYGKLSDIHGRRAMMLAAVGLFVAGSALSAVAPNMTLLIVGRTLQGIGGVLNLGYRISRPSSGKLRFVISRLRRHSHQLNLYSRAGIARYLSVFDWPERVLYGGGRTVRTLLSVHEVSPILEGGLECLMILP